MATKPPVPPKVAGVVPTVRQGDRPPKAAPASSASVEPKPAPLPELKSGDFVIAVSESISEQPVPVRHTIELIRRDDRSQFFKYLMKCSCGCEARAHTEEQIRKSADDHLQRAFVVEHKWR